MRGIRDLPGRAAKGRAVRPDSQRAAPRQGRRRVDGTDVVALRQRRVRSRAAATLRRVCPIVVFGPGISRNQAKSASTYHPCSSMAVVGKFAKSPSDSASRPWPIAPASFEEHPCPPRARSREPRQGHASSCHRLEETQIEAAELAVMRETSAPGIHTERRPSNLPLSRKYLLGRDV